MIKYHITIDSNSDSNSDITLHNDDETPVISKITFRIDQYYQRSVLLKISNETPDMRNKFAAISGRKRQIMGDESLHVDTRDLDKITYFLDQVQKYDPIPCLALIEIKREIDFNFAPFIVPFLVAEGKDEEALREASHDIRTLTKLADHYEQQGDLNNFFKVLESVPNQAHLPFSNINFRIYEKLKTIIPPADTEEYYIHSERLLCAALNAGLSQDAAEIFNELCDYSDSQQKLTALTGEPEALLLIARTQRATNQELKAIKAKQSPEITSNNPYSWHGKGHVAHSEAQTLENNQESTNGIDRKMGS